MTKQIEIGKPVPNFKLYDDQENLIQLSDFKGKNIVLYFYPKDLTPGCTMEAINFNQKKSEFDAENTVILGISRDKPSLHQKFKGTCNLSFSLLSDEEEHVCQLFKVLKPKSLFGKKLTGIERSTFLIDKEGILRHEWRKVKVLGHVEDVIKTVKTLNATN